MRVRHPQSSQPAIVLVLLLTEEPSISSHISRELEIDTTPWLHASVKILNYRERLLLPKKGRGEVLLSLCKPANIIILA